MSDHFVVPAEIHSDDFYAQCAFDAVGWLEQASDEELDHLDDCGWGGDYPADDVARFCSDAFPDINRVMDYAIDSSLGFECYIDRDAAERWLASR